MTGLDGVVLTPENARRVEDAIRVIERRARAIQPTYRRRQRFIPGGGGGGENAIWATISRGLLNADAEAVPPIPVEGYSCYVLSLSGVADWTANEVVVAGNLRNNHTTHDTYICTTGHTCTTEPTLTNHTNWAFFNPMPMGHTNTTVPDMRKYLPRYLAGAVVELKKRTVSGTDYYYLPGMIYIGDIYSIATFDTGANGLARAGAVYAG